MSTETLCHVWRQSLVVQGSIQLLQSRKLSFLFLLYSAPLAVHLSFAATMDVPESYRTLSLLSYSRCNLCTET